MKKKKNIFRSGIELKKKLKINNYYNNTIYDLEIKPSQIQNGGLGVFLSKNALPIEKNTFLCYYEGDWNFDKNNISEYSYYINDKVFIDIINLEEKPYSCMINDAFDTYYKNNIESRLLLSEEEACKITRKNSKNYDPKKLIGLFTITKILPNEELFFSYGESYWKGW